LVIRLTGPRPGPAGTGRITSRTLTIPVNKISISLIWWNDAGALFSTTSVPRRATGLPLAARWICRLKISGIELRSALRTNERNPLASIPGSWCPIRQPQIPGARVPCEDSCALYIASSKLPPTHSCAITAMGIYSLQRIVVPKKEEPGQSGGSGSGSSAG